MDVKEISTLNFEKVLIQRFSDIILRQIKNLISSGILKPGNRLPSERKLSERFGIGRGYVRQAIIQLEFYGILKTYPQKGNFVASLGVKALEGLITNALHLEKDDFLSLMETRSILEINAARLAASKATNEEINQLEKCLNNYGLQVKRGNNGL
jgi:GntR family transcriptional regulator, transcriptional repressor for pyruvate dehydrogenase complex